MSNALKEYLVTSQERVEKALQLRLPEETIGIFK
jgi:farnesyl diphosphate synthase